MSTSRLAVDVMYHAFHWHGFSDLLKKRNGGNILGENFYGDSELSMTAIIGNDNEGELDCVLGNLLVGYCIFDSAFLSLFLVVRFDFLRVWQKRRVVVTSELIAFAIPGEDSVVDKIFLKEVDLVKNMSRFNSGVDGVKFQNAIMITTLPDGYNGGRTYYLQDETREGCASLESLISRLARAASARAEATTGLAKIRQYSRHIFNSRLFQWSSAFLILAVRAPCPAARSLCAARRPRAPPARAPQNFITSILDAQFAEELSTRSGALTSLGRIDTSINLLFTFAFTVELVFNLFANWFDRFVSNGWNWFDVVIVGISLIDFGISNIPDWLVKLMRAFRVIRLFGRVEGLKKMVAAVTASIFSMMNAFVILLIVLGICQQPPPPPPCLCTNRLCHSTLVGGMPPAAAPCIGRILSSVHASAPRPPIPATTASRTAHALRA